MNAQSIDQILEAQRAFFRRGGTIGVSARLQKLAELKNAIRKYEPEIVEALRTDLGKSASESYLCEIGMALSEISYMLRHTRSFSAKRRVPTPMSQFAAKSYTLPTPYGNTLIMSPWNYPFLLTMDPLIDAIAAGNTAIVKPSAYSPATSAVVEKIICECFDAEYVAVVNGGRKENAKLLEQKFDLVFFTGSQAVGREVLRHCADHLTPAVLELGGKSPCIVDNSAKIPLAAKRIVFGKFLNCGQTCVAPDYILCQKERREELLSEIRRQICLQFGEEPLKNPDYGKIINRKHFDRIRSLIDPGKTLCGGEINEETLQIAPTVLDNVSWEDAVMQEEIFGPVLPVLTFEKMEDVFNLLADRPKPLALYLFSEDHENIQNVMGQIHFGGGCVNDTIIHLVTSEMGFGGVGESGMGSYHGRRGFDAFSHTKSIVDKKTWMDLPMRYQPYNKVADKLVRMFLK